MEIKMEKPIKNCDPYTQTLYDDATKYLLRIEKLEFALSDMLRLIDEHGNPILKAHATRIMRAREIWRDKTYIQ
jgi:hypothetical protein